MARPTHRLEVVRPRLAGGPPGLPRSNRRLPVYTRAKVKPAALCTLHFALCTWSSTHGTSLALSVVGGGSDHDLDSEPLQSLPLALASSVTLQKEK
jgi:hypothetical protein